MLDFYYLNCYSHSPGSNQSMSDNDERADSPQNLGDQYGSNNHWQGEYSPNRTFAMTLLTL